MKFLRLILKFDMANYTRIREKKTAWLTLILSIGFEQLRTN
ncbi:MAG: hypothetical protein CLLPBCKN_000075 [Chroococcidiopsis cubana SAG 39.79]|nr:hypothetical protein [Chroococcidiopsis cubana SAG 39.79]